MSIIMGVRFITFKECSASLQSVCWSRLTWYSLIAFCRSINHPSLNGILTIALYYFTANPAAILNMGDR